MTQAAPRFEELPANCSPLEAFHRLCRQPHCVFFDSATPSPGLGRYSYLAADPYAWLAAPADGSDGFGLLASKMPPPAPTIEGLPPFQGGAAGVLAYELGRSLERVPSARFDEFGAPAMAVGLYDVVVAFDHEAGRAWVVSTGRGPGGHPVSDRRAAERLDWMLTLLSSDIPSPLQRPSFKELTLAPQHPLGLAPGLTSDFTRDGYLAAVAQAIEYIHAGDIFQVNLSQRLLKRLEHAPEDVYLRLRDQNPAPFAGYADLGATQVCSASPERFLTVNNRRVETRPIKGTRPRSSDPREDARLAADLLEHPKDHAENVMIVDLLRNDLSRVCQPDSVRVPTLCGLESYRHVHHLVSVVEGKLAPDHTPVDLLRAAFPGGSITGAPKVRAMEIIAELEPTARGPYCGSMFWVGYNGSMDSSILIRTAVCGGGWVRASVGGGIVADSDPANEYEETLHKAKGLVDAL